MSISTALNSAMSGLTAAGRASDVISSNIANAVTEGYGRRSLSLSANSIAGGGVRIDGVQRHSNPAITANLRSADAGHGSAQLLSDFHAKLESLIGNPLSGQSISGRLADFESSLIAAASQPESLQRLDAVAQRASDVVAAVNAAADGLRDIRTDADKSISAQVDRVNNMLAKVQKINVQMTTTRASGAAVVALQDQRQVLIDEINVMIPVREVSRPNGQVALYSAGGPILLDGSAAQLSFTPVNDSMPDMTIENGALSGLQINGIPIRTSGQTGPVHRGTLVAQFQIRDELSVAAQTQIDAFARDLVERFETSGVDPTLGAGDAGLFTDNSSPLDPAAEIGLSNRLRLNALVDPNSGGDSWRIRDGLGAASVGEVGDSRLLQAMGTALTDERTPSSGPTGTGILSASGFISMLESDVGQNRNFADQILGFAAANAMEMTRISAEQGVDTDAELQSLMLIEQLFAANARVIEAVDEMMTSLLRI